MNFFFFFFFFQAEDGIRDLYVTGVQTCALPIYARRRQDALGIAEQHAEQLESTLEREERFLHDASHELRTPVTIARGHLEMLGRSNGQNSAEIDVALNELSRMERILDRLLLPLPVHDARAA